MPMRIGDIVPNFKAETTQGPIQFYDWQGDHWVVLFSHPSDFTPVCTTELGRIAVHHPHFVRRHVKLLAHSCDPLEAHQSWVRDIKSYCLDIPGEFPYPIVADPTGQLAVQLGMLDAGDREKKEKRVTVRALYVVDPRHEIKLAMWYPMSTGRNADEILRVIDSLQLVDKIPQVATPANWTPGEKVMILPTVSDDEIKKTFPNAKIDTVNMPSGVCYVRTTTDYKI